MCSSNCWLNSSSVKNPYLLKSQLSRKCLWPGEAPRPTPFLVPLYFFTLKNLLLSINQSQICFDQMKETQGLSQSMKLVMRKCSIPIVFGSIIIISGRWTEQFFYKMGPTSSIFLLVVSTVVNVMMVSFQRKDFRVVKISPT
jgi:hypothetical protein